MARGSGRGAGDLPDDPGRHDDHDVEVSACGLPRERERRRSVPLLAPPPVSSRCQGGEFLGGERNWRLEKGGSGLAVDLARERRTNRGEVAMR